jgi:hypothetical protein
MSVLHRLSAGLMTCLVAAAAVGCGEVSASHPASAPHTGAAASATPSKQPGTASASPGTGAPSACPGGALAAPAGDTLTITLAGNKKTYCVRVGEQVRLQLTGTDSDPWLQPTVSGNALAAMPGAGSASAKKITGASYAAVRPGRVTVTAVRPPCGVAVPYGKGNQPRLPETSPGRFCPSGHMFSASIIVLR